MHDLFTVCLDNAFYTALTGQYLLINQYLPSIEMLIRLYTMH